MSDQVGVKGHQEKERCLGIIAIDGHGAGYAQMWKEGLVNSPIRFRDKTFTTKKIEKKLEKMAEEIDKNNLFNQGGETINELIISATEDSQSSLLRKLGVSVQSIQFITLHQDSNDPIQDTIQLLDNQTSEERCLGIIAIDRHGEGYAQMWKAGLVTSPMRFRDKTFTTKKIEKKLEKMVEEIKKSNLFNKDGETITKLIISATADSQRPLFSKLGVPAAQATQFITLPQGSTDPIQDTIKLLDNPTSEDYVKKNREKIEKTNDHNNTQNTSNTDQRMGAQLPGRPQFASNPSVQKEKPQEMYLIIVINEVGAAYVQMYREGKKMKPSVFEEPTFLKKDKGVKLAILVDWINEKNLLEKGRECGYDLFLSTTEFYKHYTKEFDRLYVKPKLIKFLTLAKGSSAPFKETLELMRIPLPDERFHAAKQTEDMSTSFASTTSNTSEEQEMMENIFSLIQSMDQKMDNQYQSINDTLQEHSKKIDEIAEKLETMMKERPPTNLIRKSSEKPKAPPRPSVTDLRCHLHPAPIRVEHIQSQFSDKLNGMLSKEMFQIQDDSSGPAVVFCVNSSRILSDIQRDLKSGATIADFKGPIFMLFIKPTNKPEEASERLDYATWGYEKVTEAAFLLVDTNTRHLHECTTNEASLKSVIKFLRKQTPMY